MDNEEQTAAQSTAETEEKAYITLDETITVQAIICVILSIIFIVSNMFLPKISQELSEEFKNNYYMPAPDAVYETFVEFINSTPVSYD